MANLRTNNLSGEQGQNAIRGAVNFGGYVDGNISDNVDKLALRYRQFIAPLIKAIQELSAKLDTMQTEINKLKAE